MNTVKHTTEDDYTCISPVDGVFVCSPPAHALECRAANRTAGEPDETWECGPHKNAWNGHDARCRRVATSPGGESGV